MKTAVLFDGAFFIKRIRHFERDSYHDAQRMAQLVESIAHGHLRHKIHGHKQFDELYRIFFYDCAPLEKKMHWPCSGKSIDFAKSEEAKFRRRLHQELIKKRKLALRLGKLLDQTRWTPRPAAIAALIKGERSWEELTDDDFIIDIQQKGVDMRIGLDIATIAHKKQADRIVLVSGDSDFVPAAKLARREGIDFILDPLKQDISADLFEHIDGLRSTYRPSTKKSEPNT